MAAVSTPPATKHILRSPFLGERFEYVLSADEFEALRKAHGLLSEYMDFEESVLQVIYSDEEFESFLLNTALNHYLLPTHGFEFLQDARLRSNLKVLGFLNSVTSLRDQFPKFKGLGLTFDAREHFWTLWSTQQQGVTPFRFCERLRNYAQHQTQPVSSVTMGGAWDKAREIMEDTLSIFVDVESVCANRKIPDAERIQFRAEFGERCDVSLVFRETMACIGKIVREVRSKLKDSLDVAITTYDANLATAKTYGFEIAEVATLFEGKVVKEFSVFLDFSKRAKRLRETYLMTNNQMHFISNRARGHASK